MNSFGVEKATPIRLPSTANLMIDSKDRLTGQPSPFDFQITRRNNLITGYFTRIAVTELDLEWRHPNVSQDISNNYLIVDISGTSGQVFDTPVFIPPGFYTIQKALQSLAQAMTDLSGTHGSSFTVEFDPTFDKWGIQISGANTSWTVKPNPLPDPKIYLNDLLAFAEDDPYDFQFPQSPDLRLYRYIDFVSNQLTYVQNVKDTSTNTTTRDVLARWYFADDVPETLDGLGFPIYMGYSPFNRRRIFNPPKQIYWEQNQNVGNLSFQVYDEDGNLVTQSPNENTNWLMTIQLSEN